jgi:sugar/nucleoside kinase (ribokinase family)
VKCTGRRWLVAAQSVEPLDTIGAVDPFDPGFLAAYLHGDTAEECAAFGNRIAALSTLRQGGTESFRDPVLIRDFLTEAS